MRGILAWLAITCVAYLAGGYWLGVQLRPAVQHFEQTEIVQPVEHVTAVLRR